MRRTLILFALIIMISLKVFSSWSISITNQSINLYYRIKNTGFLKVGYPTSGFGVNTVFANAYVVTLSMDFNIENPVEQSVFNSQLGIQILKDLRLLTGFWNYFHMNNPIETVTGEERIGEFGVNFALIGKIIYLEFMIQVNMRLMDWKRNEGSIYIVNSEITNVLERRAFIFSLGWNINFEGNNLRAFLSVGGQYGSLPDGSNIYSLNQNYTFGIEIPIVLR